MSLVGLVVKPTSSEAISLRDELVQWLRQSGHETFIPDPKASLKEQKAETSNFPDNLDLCVTLGGDGTLLRANALLGSADTPVLGINLGRLGFLAPFRPEESKTTIQKALSGNLKLTQRMRLDVILRNSNSDQTIRFCALNDVVVHQASVARMLELEAFLDDDLIAVYRADGLIVATPTGSTAYNLAAGGPIITPGHRGMTITPICAHALTNRPLVVSDSQAIKIQPVDPSIEGALTFDGLVTVPYSHKDTVHITTAEKPLNVFKSDQGYFDILRTKLHWGAHGRR